MKALLEIEQLTVDFSTKKGWLTAITDVSLRIRPGETVCLVGESGSGKTITSKAVMRLVEFENGVITKGSVQLDGLELTSLSQDEVRALRGKKMAMIFQEPMAAFDPVFTIGSQISEMIIRHGQGTKAQAWKQAAALLKRVGIPEPELRLKQYPGELSGGMLQRAMIAMALACGPELLIADEPTTALDVTIQAQILHLLQELKSELNMAILLITHDLGVAAEVADRIVVMYAGEVVEQADVRQLFEAPYHPYTKGLLQSVAGLDTQRGAKLYSIEGAIPSLSELPGGCRFHPRCRYATDQCAKAAPPLADIHGRQVACWYAEELAVLETEADAWPRGRKGAWPGFGGTAAATGWNAASAVQDLLPSPALPEASPQSGGAGTAAALSPAGSLDIRDSAATHAGHLAGEAPLFEVQGLSKFYPVGRTLFGRGGAVIRAVDNVSLTIRQGETFGLVGESGSGKSTLGRVLLQLEKASAGSVFFQGQDLSALRGQALQQARRNMQIIFQDPYGSLNPRWSVGDLIAEPLTVHQSGLDGAGRRRRVEELLELVGLNPSWYDRYPHEFSGGQRQRIGIARAIALNPRFILADEAVSALDVSVQAQIVNLLQDLQRRMGLTYLFIAHGLNIVRHISSRIGVMYLGKLVEVAPSDELFSRPAHHYTQALLSSIPVPDPNRKRGFAAIQGEIPSPANPPAGCRFHTRCPAATAACREAEPVWTERHAGHWVACHHPV